MLKVGKIVGLNSDLHCAQVLVDHSGSESQPSLFIIINCSCDDAFTKTRTALSEGQTLFIDSAQSLASRVEEVSKFIKEKLAGADQISVLVAAVSLSKTSAHVLHLISGQGLMAYLFRDGQQISLTKLAEVDQLISGFIKPGDKLVFSTDNLPEVLAQDLTSVLTLEVEEMEDEISMKLPKDRVDPLAAIFLAEEPEADKTALHPIASPQSKQSNVNRFSNFSSVANFKVTLPNLRSFNLKKIIVPIVGLIILLGLGLAGVKFFYQRSNTADNFANNLNAARADLELAKSQSSQIDQANLTLDQALSAINQALTQRPNDPQAQDLKNQIQNLKDSLSNQAQVNNFPLWLDLSLIKAGLKTDKLSLAGDQLLIFDDTLKEVAKVGLNTKSNQILAGEDKIGLAQLGAITQDSTYIYSTDKGILKIDNNNTDAQTIIPKDSDWGQIVDIYGFASNIYLLDKAKNQVWKYLPIVNGYSDKRSYFGKGVTADLSQAERIQIDGSVYILLANGQILKFTQGNTDTFSCNGLDKNFNNPKSFFTSQDTDNIYILDGGNNRLVVCDKKGNFVKSYFSDKFGSFSDLVVNEKNKKVYLLFLDKIFTMDL